MEQIGQQVNATLGTSGNSMELQGQAQLFYCGWKHLHLTFKCNGRVEWKCYDYRWKFNNW